MTDIDGGDGPGVDAMKQNRVMETREQYVKLADSLDFLEEYHMSYIADPVSRFRGKDDRPDIYIVDGEWKAKVAEFLKLLFPDPVRRGRAARRRPSKTAAAAPPLTPLLPRPSAGT